MPVTTDAQICNIALAYVGQRELIDSLAEDSTQAELCAAFFEATRDELLEAFDWSFARREATLALSTQTRKNWTYTYVLPSDCISPRALDPGSRTPLSAQRIPFATVLEDGGGYQLLCTDLANAVLFYTARNKTVALWTPAFKKALAAALAVELALSLPVKPAVAASLEPRARAALMRAVANDRSGNQEDPEPDSETVQVR